MKIIKVKSTWNVNYQSTSSFENKIYFQNKLTVIPIENLIQNKEHFSLLIKEHKTSTAIPLRIHVRRVYYFVSNWIRVLR